jgi:chitinase
VGCNVGIEISDHLMSQGVNASLSIGGWTGSGYFSSAVATAANRTSFVQAVVSLVTKYNLDGVDFECVVFI